MRDRDGAGQVGREHERALEHGDEQEVAGCVVPRDFGPERVDAGRKLLAGEIDLARARLYVTRFRPYF